MLTGAHISVFSSNVAADVEFLKDVLGLTHVDVGNGRLIFGLPPAELMLHETDGTGTNGGQELYLIANDIEQFAATLEGKGVTVEARVDQGWGITSGFTLPSGTALKVYEPRHARPSESKKGAKALKETVKVVRAAAKKAKKAAKAEKKTEKKAEKKSDKKADKKAQKTEKKADKKAKKAAPAE